ncbi:MAG TPA: NAD(+) diphosphatase [Dongiaceae bacterium]|nr:NAD(+) diphosphatase [Dongiaceae bacterium]
MERRADAAWFHECLRRPTTLFHVVWQGRTLVRREDHNALRTLNAAAAAELVALARSVVLLGCDAEVAHIAIDLSTQPEELVTQFGPAVDLRTIGPLLPQRDASLSALARGMSYWHERHSFCGRCGAPTLSEQSGHQRRCSNKDCDSIFFPRIDPAVIMRVEHGDRVLLARQASWAPGMHSVLAGFVELGETLEDTVRREVREEVGLALTDVRYFASQPWPFPASLMLGFVATAADDNFTVNREELETARWFTREELLNSPENETLRLSRKDSISRALIEDWIRRE